MKYRAREIITVNTFGHNLSVLFFSQFLAALLAIVYMDLNFNQTPEITVLDMYNEYVWKDNTDLVKKDVLRLQSALGFVTSYMIGQMEISRVSSIAGRVRVEISLWRSFLTSCFDGRSSPWGILNNTYIFISHAKSAPQ